MTREQILAAVEPELEFRTDDWGFGQMSLDCVIEEGYNDDEKFFFVKKVTALCETDYDFKTIEAKDGYVFVYPLVRADYLLL